MYVTLTEFTTRIKPLIDQYDEYVKPYASLSMSKRIVTSEKNYEAKRRHASDEILSEAKNYFLRIESPSQVKKDIAFIQKYVSKNDSFVAAPYELLFDNLVSSLNDKTYLLDENYSTVVNQVPTLKSAKKAILDKRRKEEEQRIALAAQEAEKRAEGEKRRRGMTRDEELTRKIRETNYEDFTVDEMLNQMNEFFNEIDALEELYGTTSKSKYAIVIRKMRIPSDPDELMELCDGLDQYFLNDKRFLYKEHDDQTNSDKTVSYFDGKIKEIKKALKKNKMWKDCHVESITHRRRNRIRFFVCLFVVLLIVSFYTWLFVYAN